MSTADAIRALVTEARARARYFECRSGRLKLPGSRTIAIQDPLERARAERKALAFLDAAKRIEGLISEDGKS